MTEYVIGDPSEDYVDYSKLTVKDVKSGGSSVSDAKGIAGFIGARESDIGKTKVYHLSAAGRESICFDMPDPWFRYYGQENNYYWKYFKSDRSLYKPDDTVEFFGYLKNRYKDVDIDEVTVEIVQGGYYYFEFLPYNIDSLSYVTTEVEVDKGFFEGGFKLPNLQQGGYELVVRYKGDRVASSYISVEDYVKPSYKLEVDKDKKAVFVDEPIKFTVGSRFFEGTPVSYLDFNYNIGGVTYVDDRMQTDKKGEAVIDFRPNYVGGHQGQQYYYFSAYAELPETGSIWVNEEFRVFFNDIHVTANGKLEGEKGTLEVRADSITLDRINSGDEESYNDFLDEPVEGLTVKGKVKRNEWIKTERGEYYDFINKEVRMRYDYHLETTLFETVTLITDGEGDAQISLNLPKEKNVYYTAELETKDTKNRKMEYRVHFGDYRRYEPQYGDYYHMELDKDEYDIGDPVKMTMKNGEEPIDGGNFLFMAGQNGLLDYRITGNSMAEMTLVKPLCRMWMSSVCGSMERPTFPAAAPMRDSIMNPIGSPWNLKQTKLPISLASR